MTRRMSIVFVALVVELPFVLAGCAAELANVSSHSIGCPASQITITNDTMEAMSRSWTATCRGVPYHCTSRGGGSTVLVSCASRAPAAATSGSATTPERVVRETTAGQTTLRTILSDGSFIVRVTASPSVDPENVDWVFRPRTDLPNAASCPVRMMVDGAPVDWVVQRLEGVELHVAVPVAELRRMAAGSRVTGRVCDREWRLSETGTTNLTELLARLDEEHGWSAQPATD